MRLADEMTNALRRLEADGDKAGFAIAAMYKFVEIDDIAALKTHLETLCAAAGIQGTVLLAAEGINGTVCAPPSGMARLLDWIDAEPRLAGISVKFSAAPEQAFLRMKVRLKKEIVTMGRPEVNPARMTGTYVEPCDWDALIADPDVMVIDTRNIYETAIGTFDGAVDPQTESFRQFPDWAARLAADTGNRPTKVAMFCTGGIRCEKASALMKSQGFEEVYHLRGGILKYLEDVPAEQSSWRGECFVFDGRVAVDHGLNPGSFSMCHACRMPLSRDDMRQPDYVKGVSCPHCRAGQDPQRRERFAERQRQIEMAGNRGEPHLGAAARQRLKQRRGG